MGTALSLPRIVLVNPPLPPKEQAGSFRRVAPVTPPLGIACVAAVLEGKGFSVRIVDCPPLGMGALDLVREMERQDPEVLGFTATVVSSESAFESARRLRDRFPKTTFLIGGPHVTALPEEVMGTGCFDFGVLGEGEETAAELLTALREGRKDFAGMRGLLHRDGTGWRRNAPRPFIEDLDVLPLPARHLLPGPECYRPMIAGYKRLPLAQLITSRGCPYQCVFCDRAVFGNRFRFRSARAVAEELEDLVARYGVREVKFTDDYFTCHRERIHELCDEMARRKLDLAWTCSTRVDGIDDELLAHMRLAGCWQVDLGLESGDQRILDAMRKGVTLEQNEKAVRAVRKAGMEVRAFFVLGMPGETKETIRKTFDLAVRLELDVVAFYALALYPGSELFSRMESEGKLRHRDFRHYVNSIDTKNSRLSSVPEEMTEDDLKTALVRLHRRYYLRPRYLLRRLKSIRSPLDIRRYWAALRTMIAYGR